MIMVLLVSVIPKGICGFQLRRQRRRMIGSQGIRSALHPSSQRACPVSPLPRSSTTELNAMDSKQLRFYGRQSTLFFPDFLGRDRTFVPSTGFVSTDVIMADVRHHSSSSSSRPSSSTTTLSSDKNSKDDDSSDGYPYSEDRKPIQTFGPFIELTREERELFRLLRQARRETNLDTTLRVAGGWVRDKLLATPEFSHSPPDESSPGRLTSKYMGSNATEKIPDGCKGSRREGKVLGINGCCKPVDIDIALDDMLGREFADHLNEYFDQVGEDTVSVGVVLKNPEKSKHLETATMKVGTFWIDFVNLRAEQYTQDSRIPDLMRIGTPQEDAFRRDLTINALFYNINNGLIEDWTGRGFDDLRRGIVATPLAPLTTLLDDPLRTLRSIRFAARLRFSMDEALVEAAMDDRVRSALALKVSRERVGCEVDLMLRSPDPVGAMRLLINLNLAETVFPIHKAVSHDTNNDDIVDKSIFDNGLQLLSTTHDHLCDCNANPPVWCNSKKRAYTTHGVVERTLMEDEKARRNLWYAAFLKPFMDYSNKSKQQTATGGARQRSRKANRSAIHKLLVDELKRPARDAESVEKIIRGADDFTRLIDGGSDLSALSVLLSGIRIVHEKHDGDEDDVRLKCYMNHKEVFSATEDDPVWEHAMDFRLLCAKIMNRVGPLWRAALILSLSEQLLKLQDGDLDYAIEGDVVRLDAILWFFYAVS